jgi:S1-C subfamily serine protease
MYAGIIAKATSEWIQFGGPSASGSSGSPVFNAAGQVIALHYGALTDAAVEGGAAGLGFAIPIARARRWLPSAARVELGI